MFSQLSSSSIASTFTSTSVSPMLRRSCIVSVFCRLWSLLLTLERQKRWMLVFVQRLFYDTSLKLQSRQPTPNSHLFQSPPWHRNYRILFGLKTVTNYLDLSVMTVQNLLNDPVLIGTVHSRVGIICFFAAKFIGRLRIVQKCRQECKLKLYQPIRCYQGPFQSV